MDNNLNLLELLKEELNYLKNGVETSCKASPDWLLRTSDKKFMLNKYSGFCVEVNPSMEKDTFSGYTTALYDMEWKRADLSREKFERLWENALMHVTCREAEEKGMNYSEATEAYKLLKE